MKFKCPFQEYYFTKNISHGESGVYIISANHVIKSYWLDTSDASLRNSLYVPIEDRIYLIDFCWWEFKK